MWDSIIIGGGAAGCAAAIYTARFGLRTLVLDKSAGEGQLEQAAEIENYPGVPMISGAALSERFRAQAEQSGAVIRSAAVRRAALGMACKHLETDAGDFSAQTVILATGARPRRLGLWGEAALTGRGLSYCAACDAPLYRGRTVAVVGGGNSAVAEALLLSRLCRTVHLIFRSALPRAAGPELERLRARSNLRLHAGTQVEALLGSDRLCGVRLSNGQTLPLDGLFVAIGRVPESGLFRGQLACGAGGGILTDSEMATPLPGVFAAGDVREKTVRQIITAAADGAVAACAAAKFLRSSTEKARKSASPGD